MNFRFVLERFLRKIKKGKQLAIITYKHGIYELPCEWSKNLKLKIFGN